MAAQVGFGNFLRGAWAAYERQLHSHPVVVQATTSVLLWGLGDLITQRLVEKREKVDWKRTYLTGGFGLGFGPVGHFWYEGLDRLVATGLKLKRGSVPFIAAKVAADTAVLGPLHVAAFFLWGALVIEKGTFGDFKHKMQVDFLPTLIGELTVWPIFQTFNFSRVPVQHQLLAVNGVELIDAAFLSWARTQDDWLGKLLRKFHQS